MKKIIPIGLLLAASSIAAAEQEARPNILWITSEDNSSHWLGCYGNPQAKTPYIDALSAEGITFDRAYSNAPVCAVARSTILMGIHAPTMGTQHMRSRHAIPADWQSHAQLLRQDGYYSTNNSKTDYNILGDDRAHWHESSNQAHFRNRPNAETPFFAIFNLMESHESSLFKNRPLAPRRLTPDEVDLPPYLPDLPEIRTDIARYHDRVEDMDARVGEILADLENAGLADTTIVFYYSDHGGVLPRDKRYLEETGVRVPLVIRIPEKFQHLSPFGPDERTGEIVTFADLAPTLLSLAGIPVPENMQGRPFLGTNRVEPPGDHIAFLFADRFDELYRMRRGITDGNWKYIRNFTPHLPLAPYSFYQFGQPGWVAYREAWENGDLEGIHHDLWHPPAGSEQLHDLSADPWETKNLAGDPAHAARLAEFRERLKTTMIAKRDTGVVPEPLFPTIAATSTIAGAVGDDDFPMRELTRIAFLASEGDAANLPALKRAITSPHPVARYWAALGIRILAEDGAPAADALAPLLEDEHSVIRTTAAEALHTLGDRKTASDLLIDEASRDICDASMLHLLNTLFHTGLINEIPDTPAQELADRGGYIARLLGRIQRD